MENFDFIIWGRGLATSPALEFYFNTMEAESADMRNKFKGLVLDTPYESIKKMIDDCIAKLQINGYELPTILIPVFSKMVRYVISGRLGGVDPYNIIPIDYIINSTKKASKPVPIVIVSSSKDDYIQPAHGLRFYNECMAKGIPCDIGFVEQGHFGSRSDVCINQISDSLDALANLTMVVESYKVNLDAIVKAPAVDLAVQAALAANGTTSLPSTSITSVFALPSSTIGSNVLSKSPQTSTPRVGPGPTSPESSPSLQASTPPTVPTLNMATACGFEEEINIADEDLDIERILEQLDSKLEDSSKPNGARDSATAVNIAGTFSPFPLPTGASPMSRSMSWKNLALKK